MSKPINFDEVVFYPNGFGADHAEGVVCTGPCCFSGKYLLRPRDNWQGGTVYYFGEIDGLTPPRMEDESLCQSD